jgi:hypothetical protein
MVVLQANHDRGVELAGVPGRVPRPVDIDQAHTGFETLRTLRIYRFGPPHVIEGHAEEDEVYIIVLAGSVELVIRSEHWSSNTTRFALTAADHRTQVACAAYLPPRAEYALTPLCASDIAYARARPLASRPPAVFTAAPRPREARMCVLLDESKHAERLRIKLLHVGAGAKAVALTPIGESDHAGEALIHVRTTPAHGAAKLDAPGAPGSMLESWDTIAVAPGECPILRIAAESSAICLVVAT